MDLHSATDVARFSVCENTITAIAFKIVEGFCRDHGLSHDRLVVSFHDTDPNRITTAGAIFVRGYPGQPPSIYEIKIYLGSPGMSRKPYLQLVDTLYHELIHFRQYLRKHLVLSLEGTVWNGKLYHTPLTYLGYRMLPWEREAFSLSPKLTKAIRNELASLFHLSELEYVPFWERFKTKRKLQYV